MTSKSKSKQEQALQFLDDLDSMSAGPPPPPNTNATLSESSIPTRSSQPGDAEALAFIDEITRKSAEISRPHPHIDRPLSRSGTPTLRKSTERVRVGGAPPSSTATSTTTTASKAQSSSQEASDANQAPGAASSSAWGWGSVWSSASAAIQQAKSVVDEQVKQLPKNEQARKWGEGVMEYAKTTQLDKLGMLL